MTQKSDPRQNINEIRLYKKSESEFMIKVYDIIFNFPSFIRFEVQWRLHLCKMRCNFLYFKFSGLFSKTRNSQKVLNTELDSSLQC